MHSTDRQSLRFVGEGTCHGIRFVTTGDHKPNLFCRVQQFIAKAESLWWWFGGVVLSNNKHTLKRHWLAWKKARDMAIRAHAKQHNVESGMLSTRFGIALKFGRTNVGGLVEA